MRQRCLDDSTPRASSGNSSFEADADAPLRQLTPPNDDECDKVSGPPTHVADMSVDGPTRDIPTPVSSTNEDATSESDQRLSHSISTSASSTSPLARSGGDHITGTLGNPWPKTRFQPNSSSSRLRPGSIFRGTQQSDRQVYDVEVQLQHVDMADSFLCGYLKIQGLTDDHPTLTTFFEGEIIGKKHGFHTKHPEWGSTDKVDMSHWSRFPAFRPIAASSKAGKSRQESSVKSFARSENIFMRWKEHFLVPDHKLRTISGASFEGFYYICFNQVTGTIDGIYFHAKSEKYVCGSPVHQ
jgi:glucose-induced degradation protein 4